MPLTEDDKLWIHEQLETVETQLLTAFEPSGSRCEAGAQMRFTVTVRAKKGTKKGGRFYIAYEGPRREEALLVARMCVNAIQTVLASGTVTVQEAGSKAKHEWTLTKGLISEKTLGEKGVIWDSQA